MKLHARSFNPMGKYTVMTTLEGEVRTDPKTLNGLPLYDKEGHMVTRPTMKIEANAMIEWLKVEYPNSSTEFIRHTAPPIYDGAKYVYPEEIFECRIWLNGRSQNVGPDANGFSSRSSIPDAEFNPLASARTSSFLNAMRMLGFGVDITSEEVLEELDGAFPKEMQGDKVNLDHVKLQETENGYYVEAGRNTEAIDKDDLNKMVSSANEAIEEIRKGFKEEIAPVETEDKNTATEPTEPVNPKEEVTDVVETPSEEKPKKRRGRPPKKKEEEVVTEKPEEPKIGPESKENKDVNVPADVPTIFAKNPEIAAIADIKFEVCEGDNIPVKLKELEGRKLVDIYKTNVGVFDVLTNLGDNKAKLVPDEMIRYAEMIKEAMNNEKD